MPPHQPPPPPPPPNNLRHNLLTTIDKLSDRSTFTQSSTHLNHLAASLPSDHLPTFLNCILAVDSAAKSSIRVHCVTLISILAKTHSSETLSPYLARIVASIVTRLREPDSSAVRAACAAAVAVLSVHCFKLVVESLISCVSTEQYVGAQIGGCVCLKAAVDAVDDGEVVMDGEDEVMMRKVLMKAVKLMKAEGFKAKAALMGVMASVVGIKGGVVINGKFGGGTLVGNVVAIAVEMLSSEDWGARKGGAEVLQMVADVANVEYTSCVKKFVVSSLNSRRFDKVKITREIMNRAWEAWKAIPGGPDEVLPLSRSNSSVSKDYGGCGGGGGCVGEPPLTRRSSFAGLETAKPKKTMTKSRSSLSNCPTARDNIGREMPQRKQALLKSRSSLSDDSTMTESSSVSKTSFDFGFETPLSKKQMSKRIPLKTYDRNSFDRKIESAVPSDSSVKFESEDEMESRDKTMEVTTLSSDRRSSFFQSSEETMQKTGFKYRTRVNPLTEEDTDNGFDIGDRLGEEVGRCMAESAELSLIRNQLCQIERQQSDLLHLVQRFMGNSQNGIDSLKTRVSGLEKALDTISRDLAVQTEQNLNNGSAESTCCPSTEFLSPKFWRRTEAKSLNVKPSYSGNVPNTDTNAEAWTIDGLRLHEQKEVDTCKSVKGMSQTSQRGRTCSPRSFDAASTTAFMTPGVTGA
ncbi:hypothetical protein RND81_07G188500 [Saponaria officinalis]|uniref:TORTIFOLIA1/SINE1-2 N-terminal domain-containing protein n=1 Tax=Saponaria officinalis TaxID=3572 RepID=A0AAW1JSG7_SAPOF